MRPIAARSTKAGVEGHIWGDGGLSTLVFAGVARLDAGLARPPSTSVGTTAHQTVTEPGATSEPQNRNSETAPIPKASASPARSAPVGPLLPAQMSVVTESPATRISAYPR